MPLTVKQQFEANPQLMADLQQQGQGFLNQANQFGQQAGGVAGNLANWNAQNPYQYQQNAALNQMAGGGFNADALAAFGNQFNPNTGSQYGGGGQPPTGGGGQQQGGGAWPALPTQPPPPPSQQVEIGMGAGADQRFNPQQGSGGIPPNIGAPMAPGAGGGGLQAFQPDPSVSAQAAASGFSGGFNPYAGGQPQAGGGQPLHGKKAVAGRADMVHGEEFPIHRPAAIKRSNHRRMVEVRAVSRAVEQLIHSA